MALQRNPLMYQNLTVVVGSLKIDWMYGHATPNAVLELLSCQWKIECLQEQCPCLDNGHKCNTPEYDPECSYLDEIEYREHHFNYM